MRLCLHCKGRLGLATRVVGALWWSKTYCSKQCAEDAAKEYQHAQRVLQFLAWLRT